MVSTTATIERKQTRKRRVTKTTRERKSHQPPGKTWLSLLPPQDVVDPLWDKYSQDRENQTLRNQLTGMYLPMVEHVVRCWYRGNPSYANIYDDIMIEASIAAMESVERFDPMLNNQFWTFAVRRVRGAIIDFVRRVSHLNRSQIQKKPVVEEFRRLWIAANGVEPKYEEIAKGLHMREDLVRLILEFRSPARLDANSAKIDGVYTEQPGRGRSLVDDLHGSDPTPSEAAELNDFVRHACVGCTDVEAAIIVDNLCYETATLKQIGERFGLSESRVSQIATKLLLPRLRERFAGRYDLIPTVFTKGRARANVRGGSI
jgi:RNA polymerase sigma factor for flagellar operon FliA